MDVERLVPTMTGSVLRGTLKPAGSVHSLSIHCKHSGASQVMTLLSSLWKPYVITFPFWSVSR